jgi:phage shock protein E
MKALKSVLIILLGINVFACSSQPQSSGAKTSAIKNMNSQEASKLLANNSDIIILDVRTPREFNDGHIKGAKNINIADGDFQSQIEKLNRDSTYFVYCRTGNRSGRAIRLMEQLDFKSIYHLQHGITEWVGEGKPVVK